MHQNEIEDRLIDVTELHVLMQDARKRIFVGRHISPRQQLPNNNKKRARTRHGIQFSLQQKLMPSKGRLMYQNEIEDRLIDVTELHVLMQDAEKRILFGRHICKRLWIG
jgi:hypothetical protein